MTHILMLGLVGVAAAGGIAALVVGAPYRGPTIPGIVGAWAFWMVATRVDYNILADMHPAWRAWLAPVAVLAALSFTVNSLKLFAGRPARRLARSRYAPLPAGVSAPAATPTASTETDNESV